MAEENSQDEQRNNEFSKLEKELRRDTEVAVYEEISEDFIDYLVDKRYEIKEDYNQKTTLKAPKKFSIQAFVLLSIFLPVMGSILYITHYIAKNGNKVTVNSTSVNQREWEI